MSCRSFANFCEASFFLYLFARDDLISFAATKKASLLPAVKIEAGKNETETIKWSEKWLAVMRPYIVGMREDL